MDSAKLSEYTARVTQANKSELVVIVYDIALYGIDEAVAYYDNGDGEMFINRVRYAQQFVLELMDTLDMQYEISKELRRLYVYVNKMLIDSTIKMDKTLLDGAKDVLEKLRVGFEGVAKEDNSEPVMSNVQNIYAGLTYGKGALNETSYDYAQPSRGFKA